MEKIPSNDLVAIFRKMKDEHWQYVSGAAEKGRVDCSGAFVYAFKQFNKSIYHGSNRIARFEVTNLLPISNATLMPGAVIFKKRSPQDNGYALPDEYCYGGKNFTGDLDDYYHIGLLDSDLSHVLNAQSTATGFISSPISQNWSYAGYLKQVEYSQELEEPHEPDLATPAIAHSNNGRPIRMRNKPSKDSSDWEWVPNNSNIIVVDYGSDWSKIEWNGRTGYMMSEFIQLSTESDSCKCDCPDCKCKEE